MYKHHEKGVVTYIGVTTWYKKVHLVPIMSSPVHAMRNTLPEAIKNRKFFSTSVKFYSYTYLRKYSLASIGMHISLK